MPNDFKTASQKLPLHHPICHFESVAAKKSAKLTDIQLWQDT